MRIGYLGFAEHAGRTSRGADPDLRARARRFSRKLAGPGGPERPPLDPGCLLGSTRSTALDTFAARSRVPRAAHAAGAAARPFGAGPRVRRFLGSASGPAPRPRPLAACLLGTTRASPRAAVQHDSDESRRSYLSTYLTHIKQKGNQKLSGGGHSASEKALQRGPSSGRSIREGGSGGKWPRSATATRLAQGVSGREAAEGSGPSIGPRFARRSASLSAPAKGSTGYSPSKQEVQ